MQCASLFSDAGHATLLVERFALESIISTLLDTGGLVPIVLRDAILVDPI
jgi:hypothetical protein